MRKEYIMRKRIYSVLIGTILLGISCEIWDFTESDPPAYEGTWKGIINGTTTEVEYFLSEDEFERSISHSGGFSKITSGSLSADKDTITLTITKWNSVELEPSEIETYAWSVSGDTLKLSGTEGFASYIKQ
jgi:hypothetical protein